MARYTGPKWKISRRENASVFGDEDWKRRPTLPGQHPTSSRRPSNYSIQLREKQKVKRMYGLMEKQFRNLYRAATEAVGNTGTRLLQLLELRLDNVIFKLGLAKTRDQARQFVNHGHVKVNGKKLDIPSYTLKAGDSLEVDTHLQKADWFKLIIEEVKNRKSPEWLNKAKFGGEVKGLPTREMIDPAIKEQLIVEFYSK